MQIRVRPLLVIVSVLLLLSVSAGRPVQASPSTDAEFIGFLKEAWVNAIVQKDVKVLDRLMAADFSGVSPNGQQYTKEEAIADVRFGSYAVERMELDNLKVRILGIRPLLLTARMRRVSLLAKIAAADTSLLMCG
jgi:hypothetical protein